VHRHVANTLTKFDVSSRSAAVARAARLGLI
jgi:DNA-binding CsgD family transcriptional regulator